MTTSFDFFFSVVQFVDGSYFVLLPSSRVPVVSSIYFVKCLLELLGIAPSGEGLNFFP